MGLEDPEPWPAAWGAVTVRSSCITCGGSGGMYSRSPLWPRKVLYLVGDLGLGLGLGWGVRARVGVGVRLGLRLGLG